MVSSLQLLGSLAFLFLAPSDGSQLYRIELQAGIHILSLDRPTARGDILLFHRHPDRVFVSLKKVEVLRVVPFAAQPPEPIGLNPGEQLDVGLTGDGSEPKSGPSQPGLLRGEGPRGSPPVSANWEYRSTSGRRLIAGYNVPFAPAPAVQRAPGEPPTGVQNWPPPTRPN